MLKKCIWAEKDVSPCYDVTILKKDGRCRSEPAFFVRGRGSDLRRKFIGILMIVLSIGGLGFWELWGRENLSYRRISSIYKFDG